MRNEIIICKFLFYYLGSTSVVSRIHFELILLNGTDFQLKCLSKNGIFINNNYLKMSSISVLPKQYDIIFSSFHRYIFFPRCTLRFPSTDICITFSSLINNTNSNSNLINRNSPDSISRHVSTDSSHQQQQQRLPSSSAFPMETNNPSSTTSSLLLQSVPNVTPQQQQVILVAVNQHPQRTVNQANNNQESNNNLSTLSLHISNSINRTNGQIKNPYENPMMVNSLIGYIYIIFFKNSLIK